MDLWNRDRFRGYELNPDGQRDLNRGWRRERRVDGDRRWNRDINRRLDRRWDVRAAAWGISPLRQVAFGPA